MLIPFRSKFDPETQGEGSIDPLGLMSAADRLADWILPGLTARMWRPRFLTAIAAMSVITEPFREEIAKDGVSPPWLVMEWYFVEAMANLRADNGINSSRIPGIDKARQAVADKVPLSSSRYLKTPKVFGYHGVYKRLGKYLDVVNEDFGLGESGYRLLCIWEKEQGLVGFCDQTMTNGQGTKIRELLRDALRDAMASGQTHRSGGWAGYDFFRESLGPFRFGAQEAEFFWRLFASDGAAAHEEIFALLRDPKVRNNFFDDQDERSLLGRLRPKMSGSLRQRCDAIEAFESVCRPLQEGFDLLRFISTRRGASVIRSQDLKAEGRFCEIASELSPNVARARAALSESPAVTEFDNLATRYQETRTPEDLFGALWEHHVAVQKRKPPDGKKRPWFEQTSDGGLIVRPPYRLERFNKRDRYVHPYRLSSVVYFLNDLFGSN
jgi:hypothetical protein